MSIGLVVSQLEEAAPIIESLNLKKVSTNVYSSSGVSLTVSGVGKLNAALATEHLLGDHDIKAVINVGVSAGRGDVKVRDIIYVDRVYDGDFDIRVFDHPKFYVPEVGNYINTPPIEALIRGKKSTDILLPCFSVSYFLQEEIDTRISDYLVDMEYYGVAFACYRNRIPSFAIKVVGDITADAVNEYTSNLEECCKILADYIKEHIVY